MRHHKTLKGHVRKKRDYLLFEKVAFMSEMAQVLRFIDRAAGNTPLPGRTRIYLGRLETNLERHNLKELSNIAEEIRRDIMSIRTTMDDSLSSSLGALLMFTGLIRSAVIAWSRTPDETDLKKRTMGQNDG